MPADDDENDDLRELLATSLADDLATSPVEPPADRVAALRARAGAQRQTVSPAATVVALDAGAPRRRVPWVSLAAGVAALAVGLGAGLLIAGGDDDDRSSADVEYEGPMFGPELEPTDAELRVVATGIGRVIDLDTDELPILPTGELYEVWFVGPGDTPEAPNRISAGTFHPDADGRSRVRFAAAVDPAKYPAVEITAEPGDGSPTPSGDIVLRASLGP